MVIAYTDYDDGQGTLSKSAHAVLVDQPTQASMDDSSHYFHPELSRLSFNARVLSQASEQSLPLLERLRFLTIASTNLDEFFEVRVATLRAQVGYEGARRGPDGLSPTEVLSEISRKAHMMVEHQYKLLNGELLPALEESGIAVLPRHRWSKEQRTWAEQYFRQEVLPVLTPTGLDPGHPFPNVRNMSLNFIVALEGVDAFGRRDGLAVVPVPRCLPRLIPMPGSFEHTYVLLSSIIHANVELLFPGLEVTECHQFRVTRNSDLWVDEEAVDDLLHALRGELSTRAYGDAVRLEVASTCSTELSDFLLEVYDLGAEDLYRVDGLVNLHRLAALIDVVDRADLKFSPLTPQVPDAVAHGKDLFEEVSQGDILLHHPYQSFKPVVDFLWQAARDPNVLAIKQTLYRTGSNSPFGEALIEAARRGKEVTVVVEIRARFDEAANIDLATRLKEAGAHVVYGIVGFKTHAKVILVVRREPHGLRRYVHMGTGNYHSGTARVYTDFSYLTAHPEVTEDVHNLFLALTSPGRVRELHQLLHSPFTLQSKVLDLIQAECDRAEAGEHARVVAKINNLSDPVLIRALYRASTLGVKVDLLVRTICCLRPGVPGVSENIRVFSAIGRFLEHSRIYYFAGGGEEQVYCASADWMPRNLYRRVELAWPLTDPALRDRVRREGLELQLEDNCQLWELGADGRWIRRSPDGRAVPLSAQQRLLNELSA